MSGQACSCSEHHFLLLFISLLPLRLLCSKGLMWCIHVGYPVLCGIFWPYLWAFLGQMPT